MDLVQWDPLGSSHTATDTFTTVTETVPAPETPPRPFMITVNP